MLQILEHGYIYCERARFTKLGEASLSRKNSKLTADHQVHNGVLKFE